MKVPGLGTTPDAIARSKSCERGCRVEHFVTTFGWAVSEYLQQICRLLRDARCMISSTWNASAAGNSCSKGLRLLVSNQYQCASKDRRLKLKSVRCAGRAVICHQQQRQRAWREQICC